MRITVLAVGTEYELLQRTPIKDHGGKLEERIKHQFYVNKIHGCL